jgi:three-Cys-motif partner protein
MAELEDPYLDRAQTLAKHFILKRYLQALAFKVLNFSDIAYVDGFSGPWQSETPDFSDTSFMIAINVLKDAQRRIEETTGHRRTIRCYFSETDRTAFAKLQAAIAPHHAPAARFEVKTFHGPFEDSISDVCGFVGQAMPLVFIDPTGWTGYPFDKIAPLFDRRKCEVVINFMYSFVSRFIEHPDEKIIASLDPILGGPKWKDRLDPSLPKGLAVEKLFRETLRQAGSFAHVVSTCINKSTEDRPHFFLAYGTKDPAGLKAFRQIEWEALRDHARNRAAAKDRKREQKTGTADLFGDHDANVSEASIEDLVARQKVAAKARLLELVLPFGSLPFERLVGVLLEEFMIRETDVKDICVEMEKAGKLARTWGLGNRKPDTGTLIQFKDS